MPQMMPINWIMSFILFLLIFILFNIFNYYIYNPNNNKNFMFNNFFKNKKYFIWKW